jgi:hypothetical protein
VRVDVIVMVVPLVNGDGPGGFSTTRRSTTSQMAL